jgi:DNA mismatch repair protein MutS2
MTFAIRTLEFDRIRARLAENTSFSAGRELALALEPTADATEAERWQAGTAEALRLADLKPDLGLGGAHDVRSQVERAAVGGLLLPPELLEVAGVVRCSRRWRATLTRLVDLFPTLAQTASRLGEHRPLLEEIEAAISENGEVLDAASPDLRRVRVALRVAQERVRSRLQEIITSPATRTALQEPIITERGGRYVVPVRAEARGKLKGIVHDQSASSATLFVEPLEVVELANRVRQLQAEEQHEIERILSALGRQVAADASELDQTVTALAELDLQVAKGRLAVAMRAARPALHDFEARDPGEPVLRLIDARHPLLDADAVPLSLELGLEFDVLVITGPNTGGKTVALKTVGLLALMAQSGLQVPASDGCVVTVFRSVHADIGDEQSIEQSLSTFSSHVSHIVDMLRDADERGLVLLDELGAGTDPQEGSALARSILEHLRQRRVLSIATTHYSELKLYAHAAPRVENASVEFDPRSLRPTYRLLVGLPGRSNALEIASRLGIPRPILDRARSELDPTQAEAGALLDQIQRERRASEEARRQAERERSAAARVRAALEQELAEQQRIRQKVWREAEAASVQMLADLRQEVAALRAEVQRSRAAPWQTLSATAEQQLAEAERFMAQAEALAPITAPPEAGAAARSPREAPTEESAASSGPLSVGSRVLVRSLGVDATITSLEADEAELDVRGMRVRLPRAELDSADAIGGSEPMSASEIMPRLVRGGDVQPSAQIDLRGQRRDEATAELDRYLDDVYLAGLKSVRVVHGKGTGAVRQAVHELLTSHPLVRSYRTAGREAGGDGATEVELVTR